MSVTAPKVWEAEGFVSVAKASLDSLCAQLLALREDRDKLHDAAERLLSGAKHEDPPRRDLYLARGQDIQRLRAAVAESDAVPSTVEGLSLKQRD